MIFNTCVMRLRNAFKSATHTSTEPPGSTAKYLAPCHRSASIISLKPGTADLKNGGWFLLESELISMGGDKVTSLMNHSLLTDLT